MSQKQQDSLIFPCKPCRIGIIKQKQEHSWVHSNIHLYCKRHKRFKRMTNSDHNRSVYNNLLEQQFSMQAPNQAWVSDITYIWTAEG
jgi:transposase InsO family protein